MTQGKAEFLRPLNYETLLELDQLVPSRRNCMAGDDCPWAAFIMQGTRVYARFCKMACICAPTSWQYLVAKKTRDLESTVSNRGKDKYHAMKSRKLT